MHMSTVLRVASYTTPYLLLARRRTPEQPNRHKYRSAIHQRGTRHQPVHRIEKAELINSSKRRVGISFTLHNSVQCRMHGSIQCVSRIKKLMAPDSESPHINGSNSRRSRDNSDPLHSSKLHQNHTAILATTESSSVLFWRLLSRHRQEQ